MKSVLTFVIVLVGIYSSKCYDLDLLSNSFISPSSLDQTSNGFQCYKCLLNEDCYKNGTVGSVEKCNEGINTCVMYTLEEDHEVEIQGEVQQIKAGTQRSCVPYIFGYDQLIEDGVCKEWIVRSGPLAGFLIPRVCFCKSELCNGHDFKELKEPQELEKCNSSGKFNNSIITISILVFVSYLMK